MAVLTYPTTEAKARFSEVLRQVRAGATVTVTHRGDPVAEIRPVEPPPRTIEERLDELEKRGVLVPSGEPGGPLGPVTHIPGALERFLADRNR